MNGPCAALINGSPLHLSIEDLQNYQDEFSDLILNNKIPNNAVISHISQMFVIVEDVEYYIGAILMCIYTIGKKPHICSIWWDPEWNHTVDCGGSYRVYGAASRYAEAECMIYKSYTSAGNLITAGFLRTADF